jgi:hypothetical protein
MRSANNVGNAGPHVCQTFLNGVFTFLTVVGIAGQLRIRNRTSISYSILNKGRKVLKF